MSSTENRSRGSETHDNVRSFPPCANDSSSTSVPLLCVDQLSFLDLPAIGDRNRRGTGRKTEWNTEYNSGRSVKALQWIFDAKLVFVVFLAIFGPAPVCAPTSCHTPHLCPGLFCLGASHSPTIYTTENEFPTVTFATMIPRCPFAAAVILVLCIDASAFAAPPTRLQTPWSLLQTLSESVPFTPEFFCQHSEETRAANLSVIAEHRNSARMCEHARSRQPHGDGAQYAFMPHISSVGRLGTQDLQSAPPQQVAKNIISISKHCRRNHHRRCHHYHHHHL